jgi:pimeloyl-ACP methyl ester carboxylesterase
MAMAKEPVVFVHGSLSDGSYWHDQLAPFAEAGFHTIAYSRRYNFPPTARPLDASGVHRLEEIPKKLPIRNLMESWDTRRVALP